MRLTLIALILLAGCAKRTATPTALDSVPHLWASAYSHADDEVFIQYAAMQARGIIRVSDTAAQEAATQSTRDLARSIAADQRYAFDQLARLAEQRNIPIPSEPDTFHLALLARLPQYNSADFERSYLATMAQDYETLVPLYEDRAYRAASGEVRTVASQSAAVLRNNRGSIQATVADAR